MKMWILAGCAALVLATSAQAAPPLPPAAIYTDPPADKAHPARSEVLHIPTGGVEVNGLAYIPSGAGAHPTVVLLHGLPGNEKSLDLAQTIRRAGWTAVTFNYRGSWGSPGTFSFKGNLADAKAVLAYLRRPEVAANLQIDPARMVIMGHSMGGWVTAVTAAEDPAVKGAVLISAADMGFMAGLPLAVRLQTARENMESLAGVTPQSMAEEIAALGAYSFASAAPKLAGRRLLVLSADDGLATLDHAMVEAVRKAGGSQVREVHVATDHSWNTDRIRLESEILTWLAALPK
ncbi:MAG: histidine triad protein [Phenylobacterium sp.]|nr:histidine triad protein [Phenylobacterium sp.]